MTNNSFLSQVNSICISFVNSITQGHQVGLWIERTGLGIDVFRR